MEKNTEFRDWAMSIAKRHNMEWEVEMSYERAIAGGADEEEAWSEALNEWDL